MKVLLISDIADLTWKFGTGSADVLLSCGDVDDNVILMAAKAYGCKAIFAVKGNHDNRTCFPDPIIDLHCEIYEHRGLKFGGFNGAWAYKPKGEFLYEQWEVEKLLLPFGDVDIFIAHNSPRGVHDKEDGVHLGFDFLNKYIQKSKSRYLFHGHQHSSQVTNVQQTVVVGVFGCRTIEIEV